MQTPALLCPASCRSFWQVVCRNHHQQDTARALLLELVQCIYDRVSCCIKHSALILDDKHTTSSTEDSGLGPAFWMLGLVCA